MKFFWRLSIARSKKIKEKIGKIVTFALVSSQIWLNLLMDDHHFLHIFLWTIAIYTAKKKCCTQKGRKKKGEWEN
jgi:hypothetical protein